MHIQFSNEAFWGQDLSALAGVEDAVASYTEEIRTLGMRKAMEKDFCIIHCEKQAGDDS